MSCPPAPMPSITSGLQVGAGGVDGGGQPGGAGTDDDDVADAQTFASSVCGSECPAERAGEHEDSPEDQVGEPRPRRRARRARGSSAIASMNTVTSTKNATRRPETTPRRRLLRRDDGLVADQHDGLLECIDGVGCPVGHGGLLLAWSRDRGARATASVPVDHWPVSRVRAPRTDRRAPLGRGSFRRCARSAAPSPGGRRTARRVTDRAAERQDRARSTRWSSASAEVAPKSVVAVPDRCAAVASRRRPGDRVEQLRRGPRVAERSPKSPA